jgi:hypothetical protein
MMRSILLIPIVLFLIFPRCSIPKQNSVGVNIPTTELYHAAIAFEIEYDQDKRLFAKL